MRRLRSARRPSSGDGGSAAAADTAGQHSSYSYEKRDSSKGDGDDAVTTFKDVYIQGDAQGTENDKNALNPR